MDDDLVLSDVHRDVQWPSDTLGSSLTTRFMLRKQEKGMEISNESDIYEANGDKPAENDRYRELKSTIDIDGDLIVPRKKKLKLEEETSVKSNLEQDFIIHHSMKTNLSLVGLQVWKGSLLLCDFILSNQKLFCERNVLELGSGTGIVGLAASRIAHAVFITDIGEDVLHNCMKNVLSNSFSFHNNLRFVKVKRLDWNQNGSNQVKPSQMKNARGSNEIGSNAFDWSNEELVEANKTKIYLAADVIYSDDLTDAFFCLLWQMMPPGSSKILYLAIEKRYNFSINDFDIVANGYKRFKKYIVEEGQSQGPTDFGIKQNTNISATAAPAAAAATDGDDNGEGIVNDRNGDGYFDRSECCITKCLIGENNHEVDDDDDDLHHNNIQFRGKMIPCDDIPQVLMNYDRGNDLELWKIEALK